MKLKLYLILTSIIIVMCLHMPDILLADDNTPFYFEIGDVVFRDLQYIWLDGHSGIYGGWNKDVARHPQDQSILEMDTDGLYVSRNMLDWVYIVGWGGIWGSKSMTLNAFQRREILRVITEIKNNSKGGADYGGIPFIYPLGYKNPSGIGNNEKPSFRCDGLVEYVYETVLGEPWEPGNNGGLMIDDTDDILSFSPLKQFKSSRWEIYRRVNTRAAPPEIQVKDSAGNSIMVGSSIKESIVSVYATDTSSGSGLGLFEVWAGAPDNGGIKIQSLSEDYDIDNTYSVPNLPNGAIFIRSWDQAGNYSQSNFVVDTHAPSVTITDPSGKVISDGVILYAEGGNLSMSVYANDGANGSGLARLEYYNTNQPDQIQDITAPFNPDHTYMITLGAGQWVVMSYDQAGNKTSRYFTITNINNNNATYTWPILPFNQQHEVIAVIGQYMDDGSGNGYFHDGDDIRDSTPGKAVYPLFNAVVLDVGIDYVTYAPSQDSSYKTTAAHLTGIPAGITVGASLYGNQRSFIPDHPELSPTVLGFTGAGKYFHHTQGWYGNSYSEANPSGIHQSLLGCVKPYYNEQVPVIASVKYYDHDTHQEFAREIDGRTVLSGKMDILCDAYVGTAFGDWSVKIPILHYSYNLQCLGESSRWTGSMSMEDVNYIVDNLGYVYGSGTTAQTFKVWATNQPDIQKYIDTTEYADGKCEVQLEAYTNKIVGGSLLNRAQNYEDRFIVDNQPPVIGTFSFANKLPLAIPCFDKGTGVDPATVLVIMDGSVIPASLNVSGDGITCSLDPGTLTGGVHAIHVRADDKIGRESQKDWTFVFDFAVPVTNIQLPQTNVVIDGTTYADTTEGIVLSGSDPVENGDSSGISYTNYSVDGGPWLSYSSSLIITEEGPHTIAYFSSDNAGNIENTNSMDIVVDNLPPQIMISSPAAGEQYPYNSAVEVRYSVSDITPYSTTSYLTLVGCPDVSRQGTTVSVTGDFSIAASSLPGYGYYTLTIEAEDSLGHHSSTTTAPFKVQCPAPEITINSPVSGSNYMTGLSTLTVSYSVDGLDQYMVVYSSLVHTGNGAVLSVMNGQSVGLRGLEAGPWMLEVDAADWSGEVISFVAVPFEVSIDTVPPSINVHSPAGGEIYFTGISTMTISYSVTDIDPAPACSAELKNAETGSTVEVSSGQVVSLQSLSPGYWTLTVTAADWLGNVSTMTTGAFRILLDTGPPAILINLPQEGERYIAGSGIVPVSFSVTDADPNPSILANMVNTSTLERVQVSTATAAISLQSPGYWRLEVGAADWAGNVSSGTSGLFEVFADTTPPQITIGSPAVGEVYLRGISTMTVSYLVSDEDQYTVVNSRLFNAISGTYIDVSSGTVNLDDIAAGRWSLVISATDPTGNTATASSGDFDVIVDTTPPAIEITAPSGGERFVALISTIPVSFFVTDQTTVSFVTAEAVSVAGNERVEINGSSVAPGILGPGDWQLSVTARDICGNESIKMSGIFNVFIDNFPPVLTIPPDAVFEATSLLAVYNVGAASATDDTEVRITNDMPAEGIGLGETSITWWAVDALGNQSTAVQRVTVRDTTPPSFAVSPFAAGGQYSGIAHVVWSVTDKADPSPSAAVFMRNIESGAVFYLNSMTMDVDLRSFATGQWEIVAQMSDHNGNSATVSTGIFEVTEVLPEECSISVGFTPQYGEPPQPRIFVYSPQNGAVFREGDGPVQIGYGLENLSDVENNIICTVTNLDTGQFYYCQNGTSYDLSQLAGGFWRVSVIAKKLYSDTIVHTSNMPIFEVIHAVPPDSAGIMVGFTPKYQKIVPKIQINSPADNADYSIGGDGFTLDYTITDNTDPGNIVKAYLTSVSSGTVYEVSGGQYFNPSDYEEGIWRMTVRILDSSSTVVLSQRSVSFEFVHTQLPWNADVPVSFTPDYVPPADITDLAVSRSGATSLTVSWLAPGDDGNAGELSSGIFELRFSSDAAFGYYGTVVISTDTVPGAVFTAEIDGLEQGTQYFFTVRSRDNAGHWSAWSAQTEGVTGYLAVGPDSVASVLSGLNISVELPSQTTSHVSVVLASAGVQGIYPVTLIYDIIPEGTVFDQPARISIAYDPDTVTDTATLAIYKWNGVEWSSAPITNQVVYADAVPPRVEGDIHSLSLYGLFCGDHKPFRVTLDALPELTPSESLSVSGTFESVCLDTITVNLGSIDLIDASAGMFRGMIYLSEGANTVEVTAKDRYGNAAICSAGITLDTLPPVLSVPGDVTAEAAGTLTSVEIGTASASDPHGAQITNDAPAMFAIGATSVTWRAVDGAGNAAAAVQVINVVDTIPPVTSIVVSTDSLSGTIFSLTASDGASGVDKTFYRIDSGVWQLYASSVSVPPVTLDIYYYSIDKAGNAETAKNTHFEVNFDTVAPALSFSVVNASDQAEYAGKVYVNGSAQFRLKASDPDIDGISSGLKAVSYSVDGGVWAAINGTEELLSFVSLADGTHVIGYKAEDNAGNTASGAYEAVFDKAAPVISGTVPEDGGRMNPSKNGIIRIAFGEQVKCSDWEDNIQITEAKGRRLKGFTVNYDPVTRTATVVAKFKHNTLYKVTVKNGITDLVGNKLVQFKFSFCTLVSAKEGCTYEDEDTGLIIIALPGALPCDGYFEAQLLENVCLPRIPKPLEWLFGGKKAYLILYRDEEGTIVEEKVQKAFKLVIVLRNQWAAFAPSASGAKRQPEFKTAKLYKIGSPDTAARFSMLRRASPSAFADFSESGVSKPMPVPAQSSNEITQEVSADIDEFGIFTLAAVAAPANSLDDLSCYPSPFNPGIQPVTIQYYMLSSGDVTVTVYDLMGNLVKAWEIRSGDNGALQGLNQVLWDGRNGQGDVVANGGYIVCVNGDSRNKRFKLLVIK